MANVFFDQLTDQIRKFNDSPWSKIFSAAIIVAIVVGLLTYQNNQRNYELTRDIQRARIDVEISSSNIKKFLFIRDGNLYVQFPLINNGKNAAENFSVQLEYIGYADGKEVMHEKFSQEIPYAWQSEREMKLQHSVQGKKEINSLILQKRLRVLAKLDLFYLDQVSSTKFSDSLCYVLDGDSIIFIKKGSSQFKQCPKKID